MRRFGARVLLSQVVQIQNDLSDGNLDADGIPESVDRIEPRVLEQLGGRIGKPGISIEEHNRSFEANPIAVPRE